jgi:serine/threonine protein kinase
LYLGLKIIAGIIHGDIKPGNVLIFHDNENGYIAKVGDFGYSVFSEGDPNEKRIHLPISTPWNAPEVISWRVLFSLHAAKLTDVYSFGLVCLWLLFPKMSRNIFSGIKDVDSSLNQDGELLQTVASLIESATELDVCSKTGLKAFFASTLANEPNNRKLDLKEIMRPFTEWVYLTI